MYLMMQLGIKQENSESVCQVDLSLLSHTDEQNHFKMN